VEVATGFLDPLLLFFLLSEGEFPLYPFAACGLEALLVRIVGAGFCWREVKTGFFVWLWERLGPRQVLTERYRRLTD